MLFERCCEMPTNDYKIVKSFLSEFVSEITKIFPDEIDFIILAGSAARGDFRIGESDIDLGIKAKREEDVEMIEKAAFEIFWGLDKKYNMKFRQAYLKRRSSQLISFAPPELAYKPFTVSGPKRRSRQRNLFSILNPVHGLFRAVRKDTQMFGKILYGRNVLENVSTNGNNIYTILFTYDLYKSSAAFLLFPFVPDKSLSASSRAVFFAFSDKLPEKHDGYYALAMEALYIKTNFERVKKEWPYLRKAAFCLKAPFHIARRNFRNLHEHISRSK